MADNPSYCRFPALAGDQVVFTAQDDVWLAAVPADGASSQALRLTADQAPVSRPRLSPDGSTLVWVSARAGEPEVFAQPVSGGSPEQITFFGSPTTTVAGFDPQGRVIVTSAAAQPFRSRTLAYAVTLGDRAVEPLPYGPITSIAFAPAGAVAVGTGNARDPAHWKRYRGGTAGRLWLAAGPTAEFAEILAGLAGPKTAPTWVGDRLAFLADFEGHGNVYSVTADGSDLRRHTDHGEFYARQLTGDGSRLVYSHAGRLWLISDLAPQASPRPLDISTPGGRAGRAAVELDAAKHIGVFRADSSGRASAVEVRGSIHWLTHRDGPARLVAGVDGVRFRTPAILASEPPRVAYVSDAGGLDAIEVSDCSNAPARRLETGDLGRVLELVASPDGNRLAAATHDGRVLLIDVDSGAASVVEAGAVGDASGLAFSPDSAWLAYSVPEASGLRSVKLLEVASLAVTSVTTERFGDSEPVFSLDGKYLMFLSARTFDPVYDAHVFDLSFPAAVRPYLVTLSAGTPSPFDPDLAGRADAEAESSGGRHARGASAGSVDLAGIADRVAPFPVAAGRLSSLRAVAGGVVWRQRQITGELGESALPDADSRPSLQRWDFAKRSQEQLCEHIDAVAASGDGAKLVIRDGEKLSVVPADHPAVEDGHETVTVDLARIRLRVSPPAEWGQMLAETGRLMREHYWNAELSDVDWDAAVARWAAVLDRIATRDDLSDVLWELNGETGTSHAYETPPPAQAPTWRKPAFLGADLARDGEGAWIVTRVVPGDNSTREGRSPLTAPGVRVLAGDRIAAVNGVAVTAGGPAELLRGTAGKPVALTVSAGGEQRVVTVIPLESETGLRYLDWVATRRAMTHAASGGRVGYLHVPDMMSAGWAAFHRDLRVELRRAALVVDTRDNRGGHTSQLVIEKLARRVIGWDTVRHGPDESYPSDAPRGPMVALTNERAGSDGDIVNAAFKALGLGPVLGTRTWGGVIGIDGRYRLVDGTAVTQPRYSFWFEQFGWSVENHGVDPDVVVEFPPHAWGRAAEVDAAELGAGGLQDGADPQLAAAVRRALSDLAARPAPARPDLSTRPSLRAPTLPPRAG